MNWIYYHVLKHLLKLRIRMIGTSFDIVIGKFVAEPFVKLLKDLTQANGIYLNERKKL